MQTGQYISNIVIACNFNVGGAMSNLYALLAARHAASPDIKEKGMINGTKFAVFTSVQVSYALAV